MTIRFFQSKNFLVLFTGALLTAILAGLYFTQPLILSYLDNKAYDIMLRGSKPASPSDVPVIVDLDEKSLEQFGQWPWPRYRVALLLARIRQAGAMAVGLDILFSEPDRTSLERIKKDMHRDLQVEVNFSGIPQALLNNDQVLAKVLGQGKNILGYFFNFDSSTTSNSVINVPALEPIVVQKPNAPDLAQALVQASGAVTPLPLFTNQAVSAGFFNTVADNDGQLRRTPLLIACADKIYPNLSLALLRTVFDNAQVMVKLNSAGLESIRLEKQVIPVDSSGRMLIKFPGPRKTFKYVSAADVLNNNIPADSLQNKIVLVGTSAAGLKDLRSTPLDPVYPGVEAHASIIDNILRKDYIHRPDWAPGLEFCLILAVGLLFTLMLAWTRARWVLPLAIICAMGIWQGAVYLFQSAQLFVSPVYPEILLIAQVSGLSLVKFFSEEREKRFLRSAFSRYVTPKVVEQIANSPEKLNLGGENREVSMLFTDIRGFTSISEQLSAAQVSELLRDYFSPMTSIITENLGTLDKFIGDAIMAFWNAPVEVKNHQLRCAQSAVNMLASLQTLNNEFKERFKVDLKIGIGLHCGQVQVGNMGSRDLFDYTVIGDNVNLCSRMEGLTKYYQLDLLITSSIAEHCQDEFYVQYIDLVRVKGRQKPLPIYTLHSLGFSKDHLAELSAYKEAVNIYHEAEFARAKEAFSQIRKTYSDKYLYVLYQERCDSLEKSPPGADWDGVFTHKEK